LYRLGRLTPAGSKPIKQARCSLSFKWRTTSLIKHAAKSDGTPTKDEQACLQAVSIKTNNGDVVVLSAETSESNNLVVVGVGPQHAPWRCLVSKGVVAEVMSMTDEGAL
jgi:hypothetical protein